LILRPLGSSHMQFPLDRATAGCLPRSFAAKNGVHVELRLLDAGQRLIDMYLAFRPRNCFQGLPPLKDAVCVSWVQDVLRTGVNVIAQAINGTGLINDPADVRSASASSAELIGHTALFPVNRKKCEMLVVVCPGFQNLGIGTELVRSCIDLAAELGFERIWLPVDATNLRARHVYRKCGFEYVSNQQGREMDMACDVRRWRTTPHVAAAGVVAPCFRLPAVAHLAESDTPV
jgi:GNAT superfamily N-acetyltransferase